VSGERAADVRRDIAAFAAEAFANHVVTQNGPGEWRCAKPGTGVNGFHVLCRPFYVVVWGDLGDWILQCSDRDTLGWLRGSVRSPDYLLGKCRAGEVTCFYSGDAWDHLNHEVGARQQELAEGQTAGDDMDPELARLVAIQDQLDENDDFSEHDWHQAWYDHGQGEVSACRGPSSGGCWLVEALRWFVDHVDQAVLPPTLEQKVSARLGELGFFEIGVNAGGGDARIEWYRDYNGIRSAKRTADTKSIDQALQAVLKHEDDADAADGGAG
jgi:hypothetical protein